MKKFLSLLIAITVLMSLAVIPASAYGVVTIYSPTGETSLVMDYETDYYQSLGWYTYPVRTMYAPDGRETLIAASETAAYKKVGWYTEPVRVMYAPDGRTTVIKTEETVAYQNVGWYTYPVRTMYAPDGRETLIAASETAAYQNVGWYTEPVATLYNIYGGSTLVLQSEVEYYRALDWYTLEQYKILSGVDAYIEKYGYSSAWDDLSAWYDIYEGDEYMQEAILGKAADLMNKWYQSAGTPLIVEKWYRSENSIGTPEINITFRNISPKTIVSLETRFTCYDAYGKVTTDYPSLYNGSFKGYADGIQFGAYATKTYTWTLYSNERTMKISWPQILKVAFADGTTWYN